jgi:parvulin-like peptidyl-prolyl isomerase
VLAAALVAAVAGGLAAMLATLSPRPAAAEPLNRVVLRVNDQIATSYDYQHRRAEAAREIARRVQDPNERRQDLAHVGENIFRDMFQELLLSSRADQLGIEVADQEVEQQLVVMRQNFGIRTDAEFQAALRESDLTLDQLRTQTRRNLRIRDLVGKEVTAKIKLKDDELRRYYRQHQEEYRVPEQVQLREVVVLEASGLPEAERGRIAGEISSAVAAGKSLADAAAPYLAKGQVSGVVELGWVSPKDLDPKLEEAAWKLPKDKLTPPVAGRGGLHLLQLIDRHPAHLRPFGEVQAAIQQQEQERIYRDEFAKYVAELERKSLVVADPPPEAANFRSRIGAPVDESLKGLAGAGSEAQAPAAPAPGAAPAPASGDVAGAAHPTTIDTTDRKQGGLPTPRPVGAPPREPVTIPPPAITPPPPATAPPPAPDSGNPPPPAPPAAGSRR